MKVKHLIVASCILMTLSGCGKNQETTTVEPSTPIATQTTNVEEVTEEYNKSYYQNLIDNDLQEKEKTEQKRKEDLELATILLQECTKKLTNCTVQLEAETTYKCNDVDKSSGLTTEIPTNGKYKANTILAFTEKGSALASIETKELYRDRTQLYGGVVTIYAQATAQDDWSDNMDFVLIMETPGYPPSVIKDSLVKGQVYQYISKDVRSSLGRFLSINVDSLEQTDDMYIIKGTTKDTFVIVDEISANSVINGKSVVLNKGKNTKINSGLIDTLGVLVKHNNDVTLYIDKETETLLKMEATSSNSLNNEQTTLSGIVEDIGTTVIDSELVNQDITGLSTSDIPLINGNAMGTR